MIPPLETIYFVRAKRVRRIKIGISVDVDKRLRILRAGSPVPLELLFTFEGTLFDEQRLHLAFDDERTHSEWFKASERLLAFIESIRNLDDKAIHERVSALPRPSTAKPSIHRERGKLIRAAIDKGCERRHRERRDRLFTNLDRLFAKQAARGAA